MQVAAEQAAWATAKEEGMDLVTICPGTIVGPVLSTRGGYSPNLVKVTSAKLGDWYEHACCQHQLLLTFLAATNCVFVRLGYLVARLSWH